MHHAFECTFISLMYYADMDILEREREREGEWEREFTDTFTFLLFPGFWIWKVCSAFFLVKITCIYMYVESLFGQDFQFKMSLPIKNLINLTW